VDWIQTSAGNFCFAFLFLFVAYHLKRSLGLPHVLLFVGQRQTNSGNYYAKCEKCENCDCSTSKLAMGGVFMPKINCYRFLNVIFRAYHLLFLVFQFTIQ